MHAETAVLGLRVYACEFSVVHVNKRGVVTSFHINIGLCVDAVVNNNVEAVALADGRYGAASAVAKELRDLLLARQIDFVIELHPQVLQMNVVGGGKHGEQVATATPQHNAFGHTIAGDMADRTTLSAHAESART